METSETATPSARRFCPTSVSPEVLTLQ